MSSAALQPGRMLDQYRVVERIGFGGMGEVWKAFDTRLHREVALKVLPAAAAAEPGQGRRFLREARMASALNHPGIVTVYDVHLDGPVPFIAMEHLAGGTLQQAMRARRPTLQESLGWAAQIAGALAAAHVSGIVHRDLKPGNVMLTADGRLKVLDFGIARLEHRSAEGETGGVTEPGVAVGTPAYMSPEQAVGDSVAAASDIFSFGVLFYEMLTGELPFRGSSKSEVIREVLKHDPPAVSRLTPGAPAALDALVSRCLEKDPQRRFQNGAELAAALTEAAQGISSIANADTAILALPAGRRARRKWLAAALALVVVLAGTFWWSGRGGPRQRGIAVLPFTALGGDARAQPYGLGLATAVSNHLTGWGALEKAFWVASPADVLQARPQSARDARALFGVDLVVGGAVEMTGDRVRVTASLTDARTQRQLRSRQITTGTRDALSLEDELVRAIGELLEVELPAAERAAMRGGAAEPGAEDYYLQGRGYLQSGGDKAGDAISVLEEALRRDPRFARAHSALAAAYLQQFRNTKDPAWIAKARQSCRLALDLGGRAPEALTSLATIAREEGRYEESASLLGEAIRREPGNADAWTALARANEARKQHREAEDAYRRAVSLQTGNPLAHQNLGLFYYKRGRYAEAQQALERARDLAPDSYRAWGLLGALYLQTGRNPESPLRRSIALKPNANAYNNLASFYFMVERYADAVPVMEKAVELGPAGVALLGNLARTYRRIPQLAAKARAVEQRAIGLAETLLRVNPRDAETHADLAMILAETGDRARAAREIETARRLAPADSAVLFRAIMAYEFMSNREQALSAWRALQQAGGLLEEVQRRPELKALRSDPRFRGEK